MEAERLQRAAEENAAEVVRRTDPDRLDRAIREAETLWPTLPATAPAIDAWMGEFADPLLASLATHRLTLDDWRGLALPYTEDDRLHDRETHPELGDLEELRSQAESQRAILRGERPVASEVDAEERTATQSHIEELEHQIAALERRVNERHTWRFTDPDLQEKHDNLQRLVERLGDFADPEEGLLAEVRRRAADAVEVERRSVTGPEAVLAWTQARTAIARSPRYGGLDLAPQVGLFPIGEDPSSGLWEFWHVASDERPSPATDGPSRWAHANDTGAVLVLVPGGSALVGAQSTDPTAPHYDREARADEGPPRNVEHPPYFIGKYELTIDQWWTVSGLQPEGLGPKFRWFGDPPRAQPLHVNTLWNPVEFVSWEAADRHLGRVDLRLPTMVEWEVAARGGTDTPWWTGAESSSLADPAGRALGGNVADNLSLERGGPPHFLYQPWLDEWIVHAPVGSFAPNPFGLHDTVGNVLELCADRHLPQTAPNVVAGRGGSYSDGSTEARVTHTVYLYDTDTSNKVGFRVARSVDPEPR